VEQLCHEFAAEAGETGSGPALETTLQELLARGRAAWPGIELPGAAFARHLGAIAAARGNPIADLRAEDLYLACACARAEPRALEELDRLLPEACASLPAGSPADEVRQLLRQKLLVAADDEPPRIASYSGEGPLRRWLKVAALRTALNLRERDGREVALDDERIAGLSSAQPDPEMDYLKLRHAGDFSEAFRDAIAALSPRERNVLRLYYVDGLGVERIGALYQVHASTVSRWLAGTRETLLLETRRLLGERLRLQPAEVESLLGVLRSRLQPSLHRLLKP
jgi:RNA polymerase sigma-70 factor (ECF subfamily)